MAVSCFLEMVAGNGQGYVVLLISCNMVVCAAYLFSHWLCASIAMIFLTSWYVKTGDVRGLLAIWASLAALSAS